MDVSSLLLDLYARIPPLAEKCVLDVDLDQLMELPAPNTNSIAWLVWHLARVQDHHISDVFNLDQIWIEGDWAERFGLEPDPSNTGSRHTAEEVASVRPDRPEVLLEYLHAVDDRTRGILEKLSPPELDRIVDRRWDPPITLGVRLISTAGDCLQHAGQAAYVRGLFGI